MSNNALQLASVSGFTAEQVALVKRTVAKGATDDELALYLTLARKYGLDPFAKEIWFIKYDASSPTVMTSRDGYLKIAMQDPEYDGIKSFVVRENDEFSIDAQNDQIVHKFGAKRGEIIGAWAAAYHKSRRPQICFVDFSEYNTGKNIWKSYPSSMIQKVAESFVLKRQFSISGLVTQEEMGASEGNAATIDVTPAPISLVSPASDEAQKEREEQKELIQQQKMKLVHELADVQLRLQIEKEIVRATALEMFETEDPRKLSCGELVQLRDHFLQMEREHLDAQLHPAAQGLTDEQMADLPF
jgi:phage recombination protein Bet